MKLTSVVLVVGPTSNKRGEHILVPKDGDSIAHNL